MVSLSTLFEMRRSSLLSSRTCKLGQLATRLHLSETGQSPLDSGINTRLEIPSEASNISVSPCHHDIKYRSTHLFQL